MPYQRKPDGGTAAAAVVAYLAVIRGFEDMAIKPRQSAAPAVGAERRSKDLASEKENT